MKHSILFAMVLASISTAFAEVSANAGISAKARIEMGLRAETYFLLVADGKAQHDPEPAECKPSTRDCIVFVAGSFPSTDDRIQAAKACVGNYGDACVKWAAGTFPSYDERVAAAKSCRYNRTLECAIFVAGTFPSSSERLESVAACGGADVACVKYVAGSFPSYSERIAAAKSCAAQD